MAEFNLPKRLSTCRLHLRAHYTNNNNNLLRDLISNSSAYVIEHTTHDNWNGDMYGHDVQLFLSLDELSKVDIDKIDEVARQICEDLNKVTGGIRDEFFSAVHLELYDEDNENCQHARPLDSRSDRDADNLSIWKRGMVRLFISHRDKHKAKANELAHALEPYGISSFVAHDSIQPMTIWQTEIISGLETMEIMLAFVTDDLHSSIWTNQEIGFALGRNIPIVSLKLQGQDPSGFIGKQQALKCNYDNVVTSAPNIYKVLADSLNNRERLQTSLIQAFLDSSSFSETKKRFDRMREVVSELSSLEVENIIDEFRKNDQLHKSIYITNHNHRLCNFLKATTGKKFIINEKNISVAENDDEDSVPF